MRKLLLALAFASGTGCAAAPNMSPTGDGPCSEDPELRQAISSAVGWWDGLGLGIGGCTSASVRVTWFASSTNLDGYTDRGADGSGFPAIHIADRLKNTPTRLAAVVAHETGHAMGLEHVADVESIMNPAALPELKDPDQTDRDLAASLLR